MTAKTVSSLLSTALVPTAPNHVTNKGYVDSAVATRASAIVLNVKDYGAKGDGVTDDTAAINAALAAATKGCEVFFPGSTGVYVTTGNHILKQGVIVSGTGQGVTVLLKANAGAAWVFACETYQTPANYTSTVAVRDLIIDCNGQNGNPGASALIMAGYNNKVERCYISNFFPVGTTVAAASNAVNVSTFTSASGTLNVASTTGFQSSGFLILNLNAVTAVPHYEVVNYTGKTATTFTGCTVLGSSQSGYSFGKSGALITGRNVTQGGMGIVVTARGLNGASVAGSSYQTYIVDCNIGGGTMTNTTRVEHQFGVWVGGSGSTTDGVLRGNIISSCCTDLLMELPVGWWVLDNHFVGNNGFAMVWLSSANGVILRGNEFDQFGYPSTSGQNYCGLYVDSLASGAANGALRLFQNRYFANESFGGAAGNFTYCRINNSGATGVTSPSQVIMEGNEFFQQGVGSGISTAYNLNTWTPTALMNVTMHDEVTIVIPSTGTMTTVLPVPASGVVVTGDVPSSTYTRTVQSTNATFTGTVTVPTPVNATDASTKAYVDAAAGYVLVPAATGVTATDTASIQAAHDALPSGGGEIRLRAGTYTVSATGVTFTKHVKIVGQGAGSTDSVAITKVACSDSAGVAFTFNAKACVVEDIAFIGSATTPTSGEAIRFQLGHNSRVNRCYFYNWYDCITYEAGNVWIVRDSYFFSPVRYGVYIRNSDNTDSGDQLLEGNTFDMYNGVARTAAAAIRWESGGGPRLLSNKVNGNATSKYNYGFDFALVDAGVTADLLVQGNSIENLGLMGIRAARGGTTGTITQILIQNNEFQSCPTAIQIGAGMRSGLVQGNTALGTGAQIGVDITGDAQAIVVGLNIWRGITPCVQVASTVTRANRIERQDTYQDATLVIDNSGSTNSTQVDYDYQRVIDTTINATPTTLWTLGTAAYSGGIIEVTASGLHNNNGGFVLRKQYTFITDGSGGIVLAPIGTDAQGSTGPVLTATTSAYSIAITLATPDANTIIAGTSNIRVLGKLAIFKRGA